MRCVALLPMVPVRLWRIHATGRHLEAAYHRTVQPVLAAQIADAHLDEVSNQLRAWALQGGYLLASYSRLVRTTDTDDIAVAAASFTRLYDDVLENAASDGVADRMGALFAGHEVVAHDELEQVIVALFRLLETGVPRASRERLFSELRALHRLQIEPVSVSVSRPATDIAAIVRAKGGAGMVILGGLIQPNRDERDIEILRDLGALLQLIDDYDDVIEDGGLLTTATMGGLPLTQLIDELQSLSTRLSAAFGRRRAWSFVEGLCVWLVLVAARRLRDRLLRRSVVGEIPIPRSRLAMVIRRKQHLR